ncbi:hypothetical protein ACFL1X_12375 [Candidatus Hydrogenedentota bacterium]
MTESSKERSAASDATGDSSQVIRRLFKEAVSDLDYARARMDSAVETVREIISRLAEKFTAHVKELREQMLVEVEELRRELEKRNEELNRLKSDLGLVEGQAGETGAGESGELAALRIELEKLKAECEEKDRELARLKEEQQTVSEKDTPVPAHATENSSSSGNETVILSEEEVTSPAPIVFEASVPADSTPVEPVSAEKGLRLGEILATQGVISYDELNEALEHQKGTKEKLGEILTGMNLATEKDIAAALANQLNLSVTEIDTSSIPEDAVAKISVKVATLHQCVPVSLEDNTLEVAMANPLDLVAVEDLSLNSGCKIVPLVATPTRINEAIEALYTSELNPEK